MMNATTDTGAAHTAGTFAEFAPGDSLHIVWGSLPGANSEGREIKIGRTQLRICTCDSPLLTMAHNQMNAAEIVRRWNMHGELVAALAGLLEYGNEAAAIAEAEVLDEDVLDPADGLVLPRVKAAWDQARAALNAAKGGGS